MTSIACLDVAQQAVRRHGLTTTWAHYAGIVTLQGAVRLADTLRDPAWTAYTVDLLTPFITRQVPRVGGVFDRLYQSGGNAAAWLAQTGLRDGLWPGLVESAETLIRDHPRGPEGAFGHSKDAQRVWIDTVFAVCPFLAIVGAQTGRDDFRREAVRQMEAHHALLFDASTGLYHQSINFNGPGRTSDDHWSRGNGWAALGLVELTAACPEEAGIRTMYRNLMEHCRAVVDDHGLWHQEMTRPDSYVETSGTGLILYAMGYGLEIGALDDSYRDTLRKGLRGMLSYIARDGSVFHTCRGCLCPGDGSVEAYMAHPWVMNDVHAFGPVALAFGQALRVGVESVEMDA